MPHFEIRLYPLVEQYQRTFRKPVLSISIRISHDIFSFLWYASLQKELSVGRQARTP
jgi:hypothetical protein